MMYITVVTCIADVSYNGYSLFMNVIEGSEPIVLMAARDLGKGLVAVVSGYSGRIETSGLKRQEETISGNKGGIRKNLSIGKLSRDRWKAGNYG